jgi:hypothetical protein
MLPNFVGKRYKEPYPICKEFYEPLVKFLLAGKKLKKVVRFRKVQDQHIEYIKGLMKNSKTRNLTIGVKRKRLLQQFPDLDICSKTV